MKKAIIVHGRPSKEQWEDPSMPSTSNYYWIPWLQKQLAINGIPANTPEVPNAWRPHYLTWKEAFEHYSVDKDTILIGHSCGAGFIVRWLSENPEVKAGKVVLLAPWLNPDKQEDAVEFFDFTIDGDLTGRVAELVVINSDNDVQNIQKSAEILKSDVKNIKYIELHDEGHFYDENHMEVPELLDEVLA